MDWILQYDWEKDVWTWGIVYNQTRPTIIKNIIGKSKFIKFKLNEQKIKHFISRRWETDSENRLSNSWQNYWKLRGPRSESATDRSSSINNLKNWKLKNDG